MNQTLKKTPSLRDRIVEVLRDHHEVKHIGALADKLEAALSAAEPAGYRWTFDNGVTWHYGKDNPGPFRFGNADEIKPLYDRPQLPAPYVAVKALDKCAVDLLLYNLLREAIQEGMDKATNPDWVTKDFTQSEAYVALRSALSAQVQDAREGHQHDLDKLEFHLKHLIGAHPKQAHLAAIDDVTRMFFVAELTKFASGNIPLPEIEALVDRHLADAKGGEA